MNQQVFHKKIAVFGSERFSADQAIQRPQVWLYFRLGNSHMLVNGPASRTTKVTWWTAGHVPIVASQADPDNPQKPMRKATPNHRNVEIPRHVKSARRSQANEFRASKCHIN